MNEKARVQQNDQHRKFDTGSRSQKKLERSKRQRDLTGGYNQQQRVLPRETYASADGHACVLGSFESREDGLNEDECATSTDLEHNTSNGLDTILSWGNGSKRN